MGNSSGQPQWPLWLLRLLQLLLLLSSMRAEAPEQLDELRERLGLVPPSEFQHRLTGIRHRRSESSWKVPNTYLVVFKEPLRQEMESIVHHLQTQAASQGFVLNVLHIFKDLFPAILMKSHNIAELDLVLRLREVKFIEEDSLAFAQGLLQRRHVNSPLYYYQRALWNMHRISPVWIQFCEQAVTNLALLTECLEAPRRRRQAGPSGLEDNPVDVYLLGTSIQINHQEIKDRIIISNNETVPEEQWLNTSAHRTQDNCESHGTHLAALVNGQSVGIAKNINIHSVRVLNCQGKGTVSGILMGLEFILRKLVSKPSKRMVVLLPLVSGYSRSINSACKRLTRAGAVLVAAAGNFQRNACAYSPASSPEIITVGAIDSQDQPFTQGSLGTNYGSCVDIFAPGKRIVSASKDCNVCYVTQSGTSQAAAHVAGVASLMLTAQPNLTVAEVRQRLIHYSVSNAINDTWFPEEERDMTPNLVAALPNTTQEIDGQLFCRTVWSAHWKHRVTDFAKAQCHPEEELLGCSSFSHSGNRKGERVGTQGNSRICLAFGDRHVSAVARCCLLPRANCSVHTAPPTLVGMKTYNKCPHPDHVLTGCSSHWRTENLGVFQNTTRNQVPNHPRWCTGHKEASVHASCCHAPGLQCKMKKYRALSPWKKVTVTCDVGWTLTSCSAHPETSVTLGAFPMDNMCVVRHQHTNIRRWTSENLVIVTAICCQIQPSGQL
ncbi:proprotein convertase subtilisin/kexin type 9-like [Perognathus longimembris pacificus]|uniref:proprotein convertase subtilisin/kexin type 9-like n=1 Tax=Perognathus longimembris pacificus TaxID=214514 RepID=UPI0020189970|nr:proprotein convertase subtilisin/kexin type 9-like [Perognathus longimembris pacificus]